MSIKQWLIAVDQLINTTWPFSGWADETLSARAYRMHTKRLRWRIAMKLIDAVFFWQVFHCMQAFQAEQKRRHLPPEYRDEQAEDLLN